MKTIALEGHDNSGKSTLAMMMAEHFGYTLIKFPDYELESGKLILKMMNNLDWFDKNKFQILQNMNKKEILYQLSIQENYIFDRYKLSEIVYGMANGLSRDYVKYLSDCLPNPDVTIILVGKSYGIDSDIYGEVEYQEKVKELYKSEGKKTDGKVFYISNEKPIEDVFGEIVGILERCSL